MKKVFTLLLCLILISTFAFFAMASGEDEGSTDETKENKDDTYDLGSSEEEDETGDTEKDTTETSDSKQTTSEEETTQASETTAAPETDGEELIDGMRPDFKDAMDAYETFYDEYCEFMAEFNDNPSDLGLIAKYATLLAEMQKVNEAFEKWDGEELNDAELKYYLDVNNRVAKKLLEIAE